MDLRALRTVIQTGETPTVEFKIAPPRVAELAERICGLANALGGLIIIGVEDQTWRIVGVKNASETVDTLLKAARLCKPTVHLEPPTPQIVIVEDKQLVIAHIPPNDGTLYQAGGVCWTRRGTHTVPLDVTEIEEFLHNKGTLAWELKPVPRATLNDLDMQLVDQYLARRSNRSRNAGRFANVQEILLNIGCATTANEDSIVRPTNAGMLLFGYDPQQYILQAEVVCVLYKDTLGMHRYADRRILAGTITQQIDQAEGFFRQYIPVAARMEGFHRIDDPEYPLDALREAVVNALVHRDYSLQGEAVRILYYKDRVEIRSPGLLLPGIRLDELRHGNARSKPRNPIIATVLRDFPGGYMERVGSGISFMIQQMHDLGRPTPQFKEQGEFVVTFLNGSTNEREERALSREDVTTHPTVVVQESELEEDTKTAKSIFSKEERQKLALTYVHEHGSITTNEYRTLTGVSANTAIHDLDALVTQGSLRITGQKRNHRYTL